MRRTFVMAAAMLVASACGGGEGGGAPPGPVERGPFTAGPALMTGPGIPARLVAGYFDGDGNVDALEADFGAPGTLKGFLGEDGGSFRAIAPTTFGVPEDPWILLNGHFNLDPHLDVVAIDRNPTGTTFGTLLGRGDGTFDPAAGTFGTLLQEISCATVVNVNGDLFDDIAFGTESSAVGFLLSDGAGGFTLGGVVAVFLLGRVIAITGADLNADGFEDVAALADSGNVLSVLGDGAGGATTYSPLFAVGPAAHNIVIAELGEGPRLVVAMKGPPVNLRIFGLDDLGGFTTVGAQSLALSQEVATYLVPVGSGLTFGASVAVLTFTRGTVGEEDVSDLYLVEMSGLSVVGARAVTVTEGEVACVAAADVNADLHGDLVVLTYDPIRYRTYLQVLLGRGPADA